MRCGSISKWYREQHKRSIILVLSAVERYRNDIANSFHAFEFMNIEAVDRYRNDIANSGVFHSVYPFCCGSISQWYREQLSLAKTWEPGLLWIDIEMISRTALELFGDPADQLWIDVEMISRTAFVLLPLRGNGCGTISKWYREQLVKVAKEVLMGCGSISKWYREQRASFQDYY